LTIAVINPFSGWSSIINTLHFEAIYIRQHPNSKIIIKLCGSLYRFQKYVPKYGRVVCVDRDKTKMGWLMGNEPPRIEESVKG